MAKLRELTYMVLDELKASSDDSYFNEDHVKFLIGKYRNFILKQQYKDIKKEVADSNFQTLEVELDKLNTNILNIGCRTTYQFKSKNTIPELLSIVNPKIYIENYYNGEVSYVSKERMRYICHNKWLLKVIYASIDPTNHLYVISSNDKYNDITKIYITGIFENPEEVSSSDQDPMDLEYPLEEGLIPQVIELVVKELLSAEYRPEDSNNNAEDDLSNLMAFLRKNSKSNLTKAIEGE
jgi:hypothetical protein